MFMVTTSEGVRVTDPKRGLDEAPAEAVASERNAKAQEMGLKTRYEVRPFVRAED